MPILRFKSLLAILLTVPSLAFYTPPKPVKYINLLPELPKASFPDMSANYVQTVFIPQQAALDAEKARQAKVVVSAPITRPVSYPQPTEGFKAFIYNHESGNDPKRWNGSGCVGLGQSCPASKLLAICPNLDYACEDNWFSAYAQSRYGGWQNAYYHWLQYRSW